MNHPLPEEIGKALHKAEEAILHAEHNLEEGYFPVTVNRAYYSAYYCISALLISK